MKFLNLLNHFNFAILIVLPFNSYFRGKKNVQNHGLECWLHQTSYDTSQLLNSLSNISKDFSPTTLPSVFSVFLTNFDRCGSLSNAWLWAIFRSPSWGLINTKTCFLYFWPILNGVVACLTHGCEQLFRSPSWGSINVLSSILIIISGSWFLCCGVAKVLETGISRA